MSITSYFRYLFYYYFPIMFSINGIFGFLYKFCILVLFPILNMLFIIYIIFFSFKNFHEIFFSILLFSMRPCGPRFIRGRVTLQNHLLLIPLAFQGMPISSKPNHFYHFYILLNEIYFGNNLLFLGIFPLFEGRVVNARNNI